MRNFLVVLALASVGLASASVGKRFEMLKKLFKRSSNKLSIDVVNPVPDIKFY